MSNKRRTRRHAATSFESLEQKVLLTNINLLGSGELKIIGTGAADNVVVSKANGGADVKVKVQGQPAQFFATADVSSITFKGNDGNDRFENKTNIDSKADGNAGKDTLIGGSGSDSLKGNGGKDLLRGGGGGDTILGNGGNDVLKGEGGKDKIEGGDGKDKMLGGGGNDTMLGGAANDDMKGGAGNDGMSGDEGNDKVSGGDGNDWVIGADGDDTLNGDAGNDLLAGGLGNDSMNGGDGTDSLYGAAGNDVLNGGGFDNDEDYLHGGADTDTFHNYEKWGGGWEDTIADATLVEAFHHTHYHERPDIVIPEFEIEPLNPIIPFVPTFPELLPWVPELPPIPGF